MIGIAGLILWAWQSETGRMIVLVIGGLLALDLGAGFALKYRDFLRSQLPRDAELSKASHGAAVLAIVALALHSVGAPQVNAFLTALHAAPETPWLLVPALAVGALLVWSILWMVTGARRAWWFASFRDGRLITRALVKIAAGAAVYAVMWNPPASWSPVVAWIGEAAWALAYGRFAIEALVVWLTVTGLVKFLLVVAKRFSRAREQVAVNIAANDFNWDEV